jgi:hypothetical protein
VSLEEALLEYVTAAQAHGAGTEEGSATITNRAYDRIVKAFSILLGYGKAGRQAILSLCDHENRSVRSWAAAHSLKYDAKKAEATLKELSEGPGLLAFSAEMTLKEWKKGTLVMEGDEQ